MEGEFNYQMNCGQYVLHRGDKPIGRVLDEVALVIDLDTGSLLKHGAVDLVSKWLQDYRLKLQAMLPEAAEKVVMLSGRIPVDELNRALTTSGYAVKVWNMAHDGSLQQEPLMSSKG
ncbi:hypothetical protein D3C71_21170 [compost metagenome]